jgi:hypothetical protein
MIRAILIPANESPVELYVHVPSAEVHRFPDAPCITRNYGSFFLSGFHGSLRLYGARPGISEGETYVEENNFNHALYNHLSRLLCSGSYLLVDAENMDVPEEITPDNVMDLFSEEWEQQIIGELSKEEEASAPPSPRFNYRAEPPSQASSSTQPGGPPRLPNIIIGISYTPDDVSAVQDWISYIKAQSRAQDGLQGKEILEVFAILHQRLDDDILAAFDTTKLDNRSGWHFFIDPNTMTHLVGLATLCKSYVQSSFNRAGQGLADSFGELISLFAQGCPVL